MSTYWPYYYLPTNPCCTPTCTPCGSDACVNPCYTYQTQSDHLAYTGVNLPCTGIDTCDTLTVALQKIEEKICELQALLPTTTTTTIL